MTAATCLPRETLKQYLVGDVEESQSEVIELHLASCPTCEQTVVELEANPETLLVGIRGLAQHSPLSNDANTGEDSSAVRQALAAVRVLPEAATRNVSEWPVGQIGAYELLRPLGRGGMGMVVLARHKSLQKVVAIKLLSSMVGDKPELVSRFQREMRAAGRLQHPAIVNATDAGQERGTHYLVMEYVAGLDLSRIARLVGKLSIADACEMMRQTAIGLSHAHAEGIVHRDVKPSNLMLDAAGHVKILDFGLAQINLWDEPVCELTTVGQLMGTIDYMAPEQAERIGAVDYRADLYALGATLFRLIAGRAPLAASPNMTLLEKVRLLGSQTSPLLSSVREDCPVELVQLVGQLLSRDPAARPASAAHVAQSLEPFCVDSQLAELLAKAQAAAAAAPVADPNVEMAGSPKSQPSALQFSDTLGTLRGPAKPPTGRWLWTAAAAIPFVIFAGILITIETQKGQLVIQSDVADVQIKVARDGKVVNELTVHPGAQSTRLRADKYEILIDAPSDQIVIDKQQFSIKSGETVVATIRQAGHVSPDEKKSPSVGPSTDELTYKLVGYTQWLHVLASDTDSQKQIEALNAIIAIGAKRDISDARNTIIDALRSEAKLGSYKSALANEGFEALYQSFGRNVDAYYEFLTNEVDQGTNDWRQLILINDYGKYKLAGLADAAIGIVARRPAANPQLLDAAVQNLTGFIGRASSDSHLAPTVNKAIEALVTNPSLDGNFWFTWEFNLRRAAGKRYVELKKLFTRVGETVMLDPASSTEDRRRALRLLCEYDGELKSTDWIEAYADSLLRDQEKLTAIYRFNENEILENQSMEGLHGIQFTKNSIQTLFIWNSTAVEVKNEMFDLLCVISVHGYVPKLKPLIERIFKQASATVPQFPTVVNRSNDGLRRLMNTAKDGTSERESLAINSNWGALTDEQRVYALIAITSQRLLGDSVDEPAKPQANSLPAAQVDVQNENTISTEPFFDGRTLSQWFEILERDRDAKARLTALNAIRSLAKKSEGPQLTERLIAIARQANTDEWSDYRGSVELAKHGGRGSGENTLDASLIGLLIHLNDDAWFENFLVTELLRGDDAWTARWLAALLRNHSAWRHIDVGATIFKQFKDKEVFDALGPNSAWLAQAWFIHHIGSSDALATANAADVLKLIEHQPNLGKMAVLQVDAEIDSRFGWFTNSAPRQSQLLVEEEVAKHAKAVLENDESSPEAVARAASRLASTTGIVESWKPELLEVIRKRFATLIADHKRLIATLPINPKIGRPSTQLFALTNLPIPIANRFEYRSQNQLQSLRNGNNPAMMSQFRQPGLAPPYIESECMAILLLMMRLKLASGCEKELVSVAEATRPEFDALMTQSGARDLQSPARFWPYRIDSAGEPWTKISAETWLGWAIHRTLYEFFVKEKEQLPLLNESLSRTSIRLAFIQGDQNGDGKISFEEFPQKEEIDAADSNKDGSLDFEEYFTASKLLLDRAPTDNPEDVAWVKRQIAKYDRNGDGKLSAEERSHMIVSPVDTNGDGEITVDEYLKSRKR